MNQKDIFAPLAIVSLSVLFAVICFAVFITKGKSSFWISKKFKIGALLLTFSSVSTSCFFSNCYVPETASFELNSENFIDNSYVINLKENDTLTGTVYQDVNDKYELTYSFSIADSLSNNFQEGNVYAYDGNFDESIDEFFLIINDTLPSGKYNLYIKGNYNGDNFNLKIIK